MVIEKLKIYEKENSSFFSYDAAKIEKMVSDPAYWVITEKNFGIQFAEYSLGSRDYPLIEIKWAKLKPYLSKDYKQKIGKLAF